jgi:rhomboid protease GluP
MAHCARCGQELEAGGSICPRCGAEAQPHPTPFFYWPTIHVTSVLILVNSLVFLAMLVQGAVYAQGELLPAFSPPQLLQWGANWGPLSLTVQPWRLLTSTYLHGGIGHIATNMFCLWGLGRLVEKFYAKTDFVLAYTYCGIAGSLLSVLVHPVSVQRIAGGFVPVPSVGASGAIFGLAGLLLATMKWGHIPLPPDVRTSVYKDVIRFTLLNLLIGFAIPHIDNMGHIGGLVSGLLVGVVLGKRLDSSAESRQYRRLVWGALLVLLLLAVLGVMRLHHNLIWSMFRA